MRVCVCVCARICVRVCVNTIMVIPLGLYRYGTDVMLVVVGEK